MRIDNWQFVMVRRNYRSAGNVARTINDPVAHFLFIEAAGITDELVYFAVFVFAGSNPQNFFAPAPKHYFTGAFFVLTIAVRIHRLRKPNAVFETESFIGQSAYRTNVDYVTNKLIIQ